MPKVNLDKELLTRATEHARQRGYSSVEEFVAHAVEQALTETHELSAEDEAAVAERLQGLGYIE